MFQAFDITGTANTYSTSTASIATTIHGRLNAVGITVEYVVPLVETGGVWSTSYVFRASVFIPESVGVAEMRRIIEQESRAVLNVSSVQQAGNSNAGGTIGASTSASYHTVKAGETLSSIANKYGTTWQTLAQINNLSNPNLIHVGQRIELPRVNSTTRIPANVRTVTTPAPRNNISTTPRVPAPTGNTDNSNSNPNSSILGSLEKAIGKTGLTVAGLAVVAVVAVLVVPRSE